MLAFWALFGRSAYPLLVLGVVSIVISVALYTLSRWAYWLGLFSFPLLLVEFIFSLNFSVSVVGWYPNIPTGVFNASMIVYLVFLCLSVLFLIDKRNTLKSDRILDMFKSSVPAAEKSTGSKASVA
jgi:hypothetical protein